MTASVSFIKWSLSNEEIKSSQVSYGSTIRSDTELPVLFWFYGVKRASIR